MNQQVPRQTVLPGWYPDPRMPGQQRYWDGARWTTQTAPVVAGSARGRRLQGQWLRTPVVVAITILVVLVVLGAFFAYGAQRTDDRLHDQVQRDYCDSFGQDDPNC